MKTLIPLLSIIILFSACKKEIKYGQLKVNIIGKHAGDDFLMYTENQTQNNITYRVEGLKFYVSGIHVEDKSDSSTFLINFTDNHLQAGNEGESFTITLEEGAYSSFSFNIGLDSIVNHSDPSTYTQTHPLSSFHDTHWDWSQGYKFFMTDGKIDSDADNVPDQSYSYHIGNDDYLRTVNFNTDISISEDETTILNIYFDVQKIIENVDVPTNSFTHSTGNFELVEKIANNYQNAFSL